MEKQWQAQYLTIFLDVEEETDINDLIYIDIYLMIIRQVEVALRELKISFDSELLKRFEDWFKQITKETEASVNYSLDTEAEIRSRNSFSS